MNNYPFNLDPSSRKYVCPKCGKKTLVLYLDQNRQIVDPSCGRCDRQDKCQYHLPPREFFAQSRTLTPYANSHSYANKQRFIYQAPCRRVEEPDFLPLDVVEEFMNYPMEDIDLFQALLYELRSYVTAELLEEVFEEYMVGGSQDGDPVFMQFDDQMRLRTAKLMGYDIYAHRNGKIQWLHKRVSDSFKLKQCFFGSHLLNDPQKIPMLFESEKTALVVAAILKSWGLSDLCPIATGGCGGLNPKPERLDNPWDALAVLKGRKVILFPDNGKYEEWCRKGAQLQGFAQMVTIACIMEPQLLASSRYHCNVPFETQTILSDILHALPLGSDVADLILACASQWQPIQHLSSAMANYTCDKTHY